MIVVDLNPGLVHVLPDDAVVEHLALDAEDAPRPCYACGGTGARLGGILGGDCRVCCGRGEITRERDDAGDDL